MADKSELQAEVTGKVKDLVDKAGTKGVVTGAVVKTILDLGILKGSAVSNRAYIVGALRILRDRNEVIRVETAPKVVTWYSKESCPEKYLNVVVENAQYEPVTDEWLFAAGELIAQDLLATYGAFTFPVFQKAIKGMAREEKKRIAPNVNNQVRRALASLFGKKQIRKEEGFYLPGSKQMARPPAPALSPTVLTHATPEELGVDPNNMDPLPLANKGKTSARKEPVDTPDTQVLRQVVAIVIPTKDGAITYNLSKSGQSVLVTLGVVEEPETRSFYYKGEPVTITFCLTSGNELQIVASEVSIF